MLHHLQGCIFLQFRNTFSLSKTFEVGNRKYKIIFDRPCFEKRFLQWIWHFEKDYILGTFKVHSVIISKMQCKKTNGNSAVWIDKIFASNFKKCFIFSNPAERKGGNDRIYTPDWRRSSEAWCSNKIFIFNLWLSSPWKRP